MQHLKIITVALMAACISLACYAQPSLKKFTNCIEVSVPEVYSGDTVLVQCDTVMLMKKGFFILYKKAYERLLDGSASQADVAKNYEATIQLQKDMLKTQEGYYQSLKSKFDSLSGNTIGMINKTSSSITDISASLDRATGKLEDTQKLLSASVDLLHQEQKRSLEQKLKIGLGSFGIGVGITALLFLIK